MPSISHVEGGNAIYSCGADGSFCEVGGVDGKLIRRHETIGEGNALRTVLKDGKFAVLASEKSSEIKLYSLAKGKAIKSFVADADASVDASAPIASLALSHDEKFIFATSKGKDTMSIFKLAKMAATKPQGAVSALVAKKGEPLGQVFTHPSEPVLGAVTQDGQKVYIFALSLQTKGRGNECTNDSKIVATFEAGGTVGEIFTIAFSEGKPKEGDGAALSFPCNVSSAIVCVFGCDIGLRLAQG